MGIFRRGLGILEKKERTKRPIKQKSRSQMIEIFQDKKTYRSSGCGTRTIRKNQDTSCHKCLQYQETLWTILNHY